MSRQQHIRHAALVWVLVGVMLCARGVHMMWPVWHLRGFFPFLLLLLALLGTLKGTAVLSKSAARAVARIQEMDARTPVWQLYSPAMYLLVVGMMLLGIGIRWAGAYWHFIGTVGALYLTIGVALIIGSRTYWAARIAEIRCESPTV
ncbi:MAG TPA: hypothetical protein VGM23_15175 [Armatimonadota bacterium]